MISLPRKNLFLLMYTVNPIVFCDNGLDVGPVHCDNTSYYTNATHYRPTNTYMLHRMADCMEL